MSARKNPFLGSWRIVEMDLWDADFLDLEVLAHITFEKRGRGTFQFGAVRGSLDCRFEQRAGVSFAEWSWAGNDDSDLASGRGWAEIKSEFAIAGRVFIHDGDDSWFRAKRLAPGESAKVWKSR